MVPTMFIIVLLSALYALVIAEPRDHCTAIVSGRKASKSGATFVGQSVDFEGGPGDSIRFVPAANHAPGSLRPVVDQETQVVIGHIPQVNYTYAYSWASYGLMNEHQVAFGESTTSGRLAANSLAHNGTALFSNQELSRIALERCRTARCAVELMGKLAEESGFYGEGFDVDTGSESLVVADPMEGFVFHIMADPTGRSAIWAAQRVPDDHVAIVPNAFVIREVEESSKDFYLSSNAKAIAQELGWWDGKGKFNFAGTFGLGEYNHPYYGARRIWRAFNLLAPSVKLDPNQEITPESAGYPFSVKPDELLTTSAIFKVYRDYLEGTPFSLVKDEPAAGPFNSPRRVAGAASEDKIQNGGWERPISIYRNDYTVLNECRAGGNGIVWFAPHIPHASVFTPALTSASTIVARPYIVNASKSVDRDSLFWAVSAVGNWAHGSMFSRAIVDIRAAQDAWEQQSHALADELRSSNVASHDDKIQDFASKVHAAWWDLFWDLMGKYSDGYVVTRDQNGAPTSTAVGYPDWYLKSVDYLHGVKGSTPDKMNRLRERIAIAVKQFAEIDAKRHHSRPIPAVTTLVV